MKEEQFTWAGLGAKLVTQYFILAQRPSPEWLDLNFPLQRSILQEELHSRSEPYREEIELAIDEWIETDKWRPMSEEALMYLKVRLHPAMDFALRMHLPESQGGTSIVPFPNRPYREVARWVLVDWWQQHGSSQICAEQIAQRLDIGGLAGPSFDRTQPPPDDE